ncbi:MAG TPA: alpha/beta hydrolase [Patescibacteria group bacterium]|nr:alpha/beta hydrolase [Patescibacteria group bacterium]
MNVNSKQIMVEGIATYYTESGQGSTLVFLHGWGANGESFAGVIRELSKDFQCITLDFPGFGQSGMPSKPWHVSDYKNFLLAFLESRSIQNADFVCHSFGGRVMLKLAAEHPEKVNRLILTGCAGVERKYRWIRRKTLGKAAKAVKAMLSLFGRYGEKTKEKLAGHIGNEDYALAGELKQTYIHVINEDLLPYARRVKLKTFLIWGEGDTETPLQDGRILKDALRVGELVVIPNAGHYAFLDDPQKFIMYVRKFLEL